MSADADPTPESVVRYDRDSDVAVLTVDYPPVNALAAPMRDGLVLRLETAFADPSVRAVVIIGARDRFIAGADIREFSQPRRGADLLTIQEMMEEGHKPVVAAIDGHALGGGLELALAAPYRVAAASAVLGLPEVNLGLLPGGGGTQRMTRLIGPVAALDLILSGRHIDARRARELGLLDAIAEGPLLGAAIAFARRQADLAAPLPMASARTDRTRGADPELFAAARRREAQRSRGMVAPFQIIACVEAACTMAPAAGMAFEKQALALCQESPAMAAQVHLFFAERTAVKVAPPIAARAGPIASVELAGARADMLAFPLALAGIAVRLDFAGRTVHALLAGAEVQYADALADRSLDRATLETAASLIGPPGSDAADVTVEIVRRTAAGWAGSLKLRGEPASIALRLYSPGTVPAVVEIERAVGGDSDRALATAIALGRRAGIAPVVVGVGDPSGIGERLLAAYRRGHAVLANAGVGADALAAALEASGLRAGRFAVPAATEAAPTARAPHDPSQDIATLVVAALADEGARLLAEGVALHISDIDFVCVLGLGFPRYRGGPMYAAERIGLAHVLQSLESHGVEPAPLLAACARSTGHWPK